MATVTGTAIIRAQVPAAMGAELLRLAAQHDRTLSAEVRRALARYVKPACETGERSA